MKRNSLALTPRLSAIYQRCLQGEPVWDLCCDHGLLGLWALQSGEHPKVVFNDSVAHILERLVGKLGVYAARARMICALAEEIGEELTGSVVIAGVGADKIVKILGSHHERGTLRARRIIVCPERNESWMIESIQQNIPSYEMVECFEIIQGPRKRMVVQFDRTVHGP